MRFSYTLVTTLLPIFLPLYAKPVSILSKASFSTSCKDIKINSLLLKSRNRMQRIDVARISSSCCVRVVATVRLYSTCKLYGTITATHIINMTFRQLCYSGQIWFPCKMGSVLQWTDLPLNNYFCMDSPDIAKLSTIVQYPHSVKRICPCMDRSGIYWCRGTSVHDPSTEQLPWVYY